MDVNRSWWFSPVDLIILDPRIEFEKACLLELTHVRQRESTVSDKKSVPAKCKCWPTGGLMLGQRLRRWSNIKPSVNYLFSSGRGGGGLLVVSMEL